MKLIFLLVIVPIVFAQQNIIPKTQYVVVAPFRIRQGKPYNVFVVRFGVKKSISVKLTITGTTDSGASFNPIVRNANINYFSSRIFLSIDTTNIEKGTYFLIVEGEGYTEQRPLTYAMKDASVLIQLEKAVYAPGHLVKGRLFAFNLDTNAVTPRDNCDITIRDPNDDIVTIYSQIKFVKGKSEFRFQLADKPPLGLWYVIAQCGDNEVAGESFEVNDYELPPYELTVTIPHLNSIPNQKVPVEIKAQYTFNEPASGTGVLTIILDGLTILQKNVNVVNGHASFELDMQTELQSENYYSYTFTMHDSMLNSAVSVEGNFQVVSFIYIIEVRGNRLLGPGSTYDYTVSVKNVDGSPAPASTTVTVTIDPIGQQQTLQLSVDGTASGSVIIPQGVVALSFIAEATNALNGHFYAYYPDSPSILSVGLTVATDKPKINEDIRVIVSVAEDVSSVYYFTSSKGLLLTSDKLSFSPGQRTTSFMFRPNFACAPRCHVLAYYINKAGDFVYGRQIIHLNDKLPNYVKLSFNNTEVEPGDNYRFRVQSKCDSTVSLTAIDQSVLLLRSGNELQTEEVFRKLESYQYADARIYDTSYLPNYEYTFNQAHVYPITNIPIPQPPTYAPAPPSTSRPASQENNSARRALKPVKVRKDFSETFCWTDVVTNSQVSSQSCTAKLRCKVPDSITKYLVYGVAMNTRYGMGLTEIPSNITTKLPFFMVMDTPYSVMRYEIITLDIAFFNNINQDQTITITITKASSFVGVDLTKLGWTATSTGYVKKCFTKAFTNFKVQFSLLYKIIGIFNFKVVARGPLAGDAVEKPIRVIPEGIPRTITVTNLLLVNAGNSPLNANLQCVYPNGVYADTKQVYATVIGDLLGKALNNLENLIEMPQGCGEQTLLRLVPDLEIHAYLIATGKLTPAIEAKLLEFEEKGVQNHLAFKRGDGGFSAFLTDPASSTWLTAYTLKALTQAREYVLVDDQVIKDALGFVMDQHQSDGTFVELGRVSNANMQGGTNNGIAMTAYIAIVLSKFISKFPQHQTKYDLTIEYLATQSSTITNVYELGIIAYALKLAGHSEATNAFNTFFGMKDGSIPNMILWRATLNPPANPYNTLSLDIEITGYGLELCLLFNMEPESVEIVRYLMSQSNKFGGYGSSQDTVVALGALSHFATIYISNNDVSLVLTPNVGNPIDTEINAANALTLQQYDLDEATTKLDVDATSTSSGLAIVSLICNFYQDPSMVVPSFTVTTEFFRQCRYIIGFKVCATYIPQGTSNMAIVRVSMPSGFEYEQWWGPPNNPDISKTEVSNQRTLVTFYFDTIGNTPSCVDVTAYRYKFVTDLKGGNIIVNDYYDTSKEGVAHYDVPDLSAPCW